MTLNYKLQLINKTQDVLPGIWHINRLKKGTEITPQGSGQITSYASTVP